MLSIVFIARAEPYFIEGDIVIVEGAKLDTGFFVWDPNAEVEDSTETPESVDTSPIENETRVSEDSESRMSSAKEIVEKVPESVQNNIPGSPWESVIVAFVVVFILLTRKN